MSNATPTATTASISMEINSIDAALLSAWRDPRERRTLFRLEQLLVDFMSLSDSTMDVSSQKLSNNFQRLLLHRLADRFRVSRETVLSYEKPQQTTIRLIKTEHSLIPSPLFIDITADDDGDDCCTTYPAKDDAPAINVEDLDCLQQQQQQLNSSKKKLMIMKRGTAKHNAAILTNKEHPPKPKQQRNLRGKNLSDKEKAYAEARARIFNYTTEEQQQQLVTTDDNNNNLSHSNSTNTLAEEEQKSTTATPPSSPAIISDSTTTNTTTTSTVATTNIYEEISSTTNTFTSTSSKISKVTWRNRKQEECDPDFQRKSSISLLLHQQQQQQQQPQDSYPYTQQQYYYPSNYYGTMMESFYPMNDREETLQASSEPFYPKVNEVDEYCQENTSSTATPQVISTSHLSNTTGSSTVHAHPSFSTSYHSEFPALR